MLLFYIWYYLAKQTLRNRIMKIELGKNISPREIESRIQAFWDENNFWDNDVKSNKKSFCVMMPPPNVTGNLHMGHALDNVLTDIICRYKRMAGFDVLWQPGTDHASIATQLLIERDLSKRGINPKEIISIKQDEPYKVDEYYYHTQRTAMNSKDTKVKVKVK